MKIEITTGPHPKTMSKTEAKTTNVRRQKSEEIKFIFDDLSDGVVRSRLKEAIKRSRS
jgi:hypothetical protein